MCRNAGNTCHSKHSHDDADGDGDVDNDLAMINIVTHMTKVRSTCHSLPGGAGRQDKARVSILKNYSVMYLILGVSNHYYYYCGYHRYFITKV